MKSSASSKPNKRDLTQGSIIGHVLRMSVPMAIGIGAIISFSIADIYFIGQLGATELAAVSYTIPITTLFFNLIFGLAIAMSAVVSRKIGAGNRDEVKSIATIGIAMAVLLSSTMAMFCYWGLDGIFKGLGAGDETMPYIEKYMVIWLVGAVFLSVPVVANSAIRGTGDSKWPALVMVIVAVVNIILDPILIFGLWGMPAMGVQGAAVASLIAYIIATITALSILMFREKLLSPMCLFHRDAWKLAAKLLLVIAIPVSLANVIAPILTYGYTAMLSTIGNDAVAGYGIASRFEAFALIPIMALAGGMAPLVGQNYGAGNQSRVSEALRKALKFAVIYGIGSAIVFYILAPYLTKPFSENVYIQGFASQYLMYVPLSYVGMSIFAVVTSMMNATEMPKQSLVLNLIKSFVIALPLGWILIQYYGFSGFATSVIATNMVAMVLSLFFVKRIHCVRVDESV